MSVQDLRDVLREHADATPPVNPARRTEVESRIRRIRTRRTAGMGGVALVAAAALGFAFLPGTAEPPPQATVTTAQPSSPLPERFTSPDGSAYRRVAMKTMRSTGKEKTTITVPYTGKPLDVAGSCAGPKDGTVPPRVSTAAPGPDARFYGCAKDMQLRPVDVPKGATQVEIVFDTVISGRGCVWNKDRTRCVPQKPKPSDWTLAVYEWTPPVTPVEPAPPRDLPARLGPWKLSDTGSGTWPRDKSVAFDFVGTGGRVGIDRICSGDVADRLWFAMEVNGRDIGVSGNCGIWTRGTFPSAMTEVDTPAGRRITITVKLSMRGMQSIRPVRWSVGLYKK